VITKDLDEESRSALTAQAARTVPLLTSTRGWEDFEVPGSPYFVYVDGTGRVVGEGSAATWPGVAALMAQARDDADAGRARAS
jgi:hypothetical protein